MRTIWSFNKKHKESNSSLTTQTPTLGIITLFEYIDYETHHTLTNLKPIV